MRRESACGSKPPSETYTGTTEGLEPGGLLRVRRDDGRVLPVIAGTLSRGGLMLLTLDVGNTNTVLGFFRGAELVAHWRLTTARDQTVDEYGILTRELFTLAGIDPSSVSGVIISSVVPPLNSTLEEMSERYFHVKALFIEPGVKTGMPVLYDNPQEVGADRIVNSVAAFAKYGGPCIVVDFGTAINFDVVSARGEYMGGVLAPGIGISAEALFSRAARLFRVEIKDPGKNHRHEHDAVAAVRPLLRVRGHGGRNRHAHQGGARRNGARDRDGRAGAADRARFAAHRNHRRISHPGRASHRMGAESSGEAHPRAARKKSLPSRRQRKKTPVLNPREAMAEFNYFNYFTEIEEYFWQKRGAHLLVSPLDWAIVETWQKAGIPLSAVLKGIDRAFENYARSRRAAAGAN